MSIFQLEIHMQSTKSHLSQTDIGTLLAIGATIFGAWMRLMPPALAGFPINDGGLFYVMMRALRENNFHLPNTIQYNGQMIPFTYPPLAFYIGSVLGSLFHIPDIEILRWLPAVVLTLSVPLFFLLAKTVLQSPITAGLAAVLYAFIPRAVTWYEMGGGLTRSVGLVFLLLAEREIYLLFTEKAGKHIFFSGLYCSLVVISHPEAGLHTFFVGVFFWLMLSHNWAGFKKALAVGILVILLSSVWWLPAVLTHGIQPILAASKTGVVTLYALMIPLLFNFTGETLAAIIGILGMIGFFLQLTKKEYLLPVWVFIHFIQLRDAEGVAVIPLAMLAAIAIIEVILPALQNARQHIQNGGTANPMTAGPAAVFVVFLGLYLIVNMTNYDIQFAGQAVSLANRSAFQWTAENTPPGSRFLILTGELNPYNDGTKEWFPALTGRVSLNTVQGMEWMQKTSFAAFFSRVVSLETCIYDSSPLACLQKASAEVQPQLDYIYISRIPANSPLSNLSAKNPRGDRLIAELDAVPSNYQRIYQTDEVVIYKVNIKQ